MSKRDLNQALKSVNQLFKGHTGLSFQTKRDYHLGTKRIVHELHAGGYLLRHIKGLQFKHIHYLIDHWQKKGLSNATIKNRVSQMRYLAVQLNKPNLIPDKNEALNIGKRSYISKTSKAIHEFDASRFDNLLVHFSVRLQQAFGLRREEAIKFTASYADRGDHIELRASWTKGGIARSVPVVTPEQRALLDEIKSVIKRDYSLIPENKTYACQRQIYDEAVQSSGYKNLHGLRHAYAQRRYYEMTTKMNKGAGWHAPFYNGPAQKSLNESQKRIDYLVRLAISQELGHSRLQISTIYLGK